MVRVVDSVVMFINVIFRLGFFRSIALRNDQALQDTLRLLTLWFKYGSDDEVSHTIGSGFSSVDVDIWLVVIPQVKECLCNATFA